MEDVGLDDTGPTESFCSELEWELIGLGTGAGAPHPDMPGLYRSHPLPSRPPTPLESFIQMQAFEKEVELRGVRRGEGRRRVCRTSFCSLVDCQNIIQYYHNTRNRL